MRDDKLKNFIKNHILIIGIVFIALAIRLYVSKPYPPFWDASAYILMGKYFFSSGQVGLIEPFRPICWPLFLGFIWKLGLDPILWGRIFVLLFSMGNIILIYCIGKKVYGSKTGVLAALFLSVSPTYIFWGNNLYTGIPASFLGLLSIYLFFEKQHFLSGVIGVLAFFTKFVQLMPIVLLAGINSFSFDPIKISRNFIKLAVGVIIAILPFLFFNLIMYGNFFYPFLEGKTIYGQISYEWSAGILACINKLLTRESWIFLCVPLSVFSFFRNDIRNQEKMTLIFIAILMFIWVGKLQSEILRFLISALPYLYLLSADGLIKGYNYFKRKNIFGKYFVWIIIIAVFSMQFYQVMTIRFPKNQLNPLQSYVLKNENNIRGAVWISNPQTLVFSNLKAEELMYYPTFNLEKINKLSSKISGADYIFLNSSELPCRPQNDLFCQEAKEKLIEEIKQTFKAEILRENDSGEIIYGVFKRQ